MNYDEYLMHLNRQFDENKVKRDKGGRFAKKAESSAASAVKNAKKRAQKETIRNKINSVIGMRKPINIVGDGAASAVKNAKRRSELRSVANKKTKTPLQQPWKLLRTHLPKLERNIPSKSSTKSRANLAATSISSKAGRPRIL